MVVENGYTAGGRLRFSSLLRLLREPGVSHGGSNACSSVALTGLSQRTRKIAVR